ncbi:MAG: hypothetical protein ACPL7M_08585 [Bryobacteraceae bacterium]
MVLIIAVGLAVTSTLAAAAWIVWKLNRSLQPEPFDAEWWEHFSVDKYAPLGHLLDASEMDFLTTQCDGGWRLAWRFRSQRARIARQYLDEMKTDFERLQAVGQALMVAGRYRPGFQDELFRHRVRFTRAWWRVRVQVALWRLGLGGVDAQKLLETMRRSATSVQAVFAPAA